MSKEKSKPLYERDIKSGDVIYIGMLPHGRNKSETCFSLYFNGELITGIKEKDTAGDENSYFNAGRLFRSKLETRGIVPSDIEVINGGRVISRKCKLTSCNKLSKGNLEIFLESLRNPEFELEEVEAEPVKHSENNFAYVGTLRHSIWEADTFNEYAYSLWLKGVLTKTIKIINFENSIKNSIYAGKEFKRILMATGISSEDVRTVNGKRTSSHNEEILSCDRLDDNEEIRSFEKAMLVPKAKKLDAAA